mmetsp:Transcript_18698/g.33145  ORF Transcript_18698/g.33145 Transcript_18698/m.33145 type:complete len:347 (+) Transcript_18698:2129-3169(+)
MSASGILRECLEQLVRREDLSAEIVERAMGEIASGNADPVQVGAFLSLLAAKGETPDEIAALAAVMRRSAVKVDIPHTVVDLVGTGGDGHNTVNISTSAAVVAAACGAKVAKHGSTSVSSRSGSSDVLLKLGVPHLSPSNIKECVENAGIAFMFAPKFHPAMAHVVPVRKALGIRTVFNILGPLLNPAGAKRLMLGVYSPALLDTYAKVVQKLGAEHALIVHCCGLDELAAVGVADAIEVTQDKIERIQIDPASMGIAACTIKDLEGGGPEQNAEIIRNVFSGGDGAKGPIGDTIALNAGAALYVFGIADSIEAGFKMASEKLVSGEVLPVLEKFSKVATALDESS